MIQILEVLLVLTFVLAGVAVMVGIVEPEDALRRLAVFLIVVLVVPALITATVRDLIVPAVTSLWMLLKPGLIIVAVLALVMLVVWIVFSMLGNRLGVNR